MLLNKPLNDNSIFFKDKKPKMHCSRLLRTSGVSKHFTDCKELKMAIC